MGDSDKALETQKEELAAVEESERTRDRRCYIPRTDIYETADEIVVVSDVPGVDKNAIDVTLEKNILTINAYLDNEEPQGYSLAYSEYEVGDFQRSFRISDEIDREKIEAVVRDGVLRVHLPKAAAARTRKISVRAG